MYKSFSFSYFICSIQNKWHWRTVSWHELIKGKFLCTGWEAKSSPARVWITNQQLQRDWANSMSQPYYHCWVPKRQWKWMGIRFGFNPIVTQVWVTLKKLQRERTNDSRCLLDSQKKKNEDRSWRTTKGRIWVDGRRWWTCQGDSPSRRALGFLLRPLQALSFRIPRCQIIRPDLYRFVLSYYEAWILEMLGSLILSWLTYGNILGHTEDDCMILVIPWAKESPTPHQFIHPNPQWFKLNTNMFSSSWPTMPLDSTKPQTRWCVSSRSGWKVRLQNSQGTSFDGYVVATQRASEGSVGPVGRSSRSSRRVLRSKS